MGWGEGAGGNGVRFGGLNRDGILDILSSNSLFGAPKICSMLGVGDLTFGLRVDYVMDLGNDVESGDRNRDGIPDGVTATPDSLRVLFGSGNGSFVAAPGGIFVGNP